MNAFRRLTLNRLFAVSILFVLLMTAILTSVVNVYAEAYDYVISISSRQIEYVHLGEDIYYSYSYKASKVSNGDSITVNDNSFSIVVTITEQDSIPDIGSAEFVFSNNGQAQSVNQIITVYEKGGKRYPGAYASWDVTVNAIPPQPKPSSLGSHGTGSNLTAYTASSAINNDNSASSTSHSSFLPIFGGIATLFGISKITRSKATKRNSTSNSVHHNTSSRPNLTYSEQVPRPTTSIILCPRCGRPMVRRNGRYGPFYGCPNYPRCRGTRSISYR